MNKLPKYLIKLVGVSLIALATTIIYFAIHFWYEEETLIIMYASLCFVLIMAAIILLLGFTLFVAEITYKKEVTVIEKKVKEEE